MIITNLKPILCIAFLLCALGTHAATTTVDLTVKIEGARNDRGKVIVTLHNQKKGFPGKNAISEKKTILKDGKATVVFEGVAPGVYAVALIHDEDNNGKVKTSLIGIPKEGIGTSNNVKPKFGPPKFSLAKFEIKDVAVAIKISVLYL